MSDFFNPYIEAAPIESNLVFNSRENYWFLVNNELPLSTVCNSYSDSESDFLFIDCSRSYPRNSNYGFIKDIIDFILNSEHFISNKISSNACDIIKEIDELGNDDFKIKKLIFSFFEELILNEKHLIVLLFRDFHILTENIGDKEIIILREILLSSKKVRFWCFSDEKAESNCSRLKSKFLLSFTLANNNQIQTFLTCLQCDPNILFKQVKTKQLIKMEKVKLFISYAHDDESYKDGFINLLNELQIGGIIEEWNDRYIIPGKEWNKEIREKLYQSQIVLFLVSKNFLSSNYIKDVEIKNTLSRYEQDEVLIISIILEKCDFKTSGLSKFQSLPKDLIPVSEWRPELSAWNNVIDGLKKSIEYLHNNGNELSGLIQNAKSEMFINQGGQNNINIVNNNGTINYSK